MPKVSIPIKMILPMHMKTFHLNTAEHFLGISINMVHNYTFIGAQILCFSFLVCFHVFIHIILMIRLYIQEF